MSEKEAFSIPVSVRETSVEEISVEFVKDEDAVLYSGLRKQFLDETKSSSKD